MNRVHPVVPSPAPEGSCGGSRDRLPAHTLTTYCIEIRGELDGRFAGLFEGWELHRHDGSTEVTGAVANATGLQRILERCEDLGLEVVRVRAVEPTRS